MLKKFFLASFFLILASSFLYAQGNQIIHLNNSVYTYIKHFQERGYLVDLNPTHLPYTRGEVNTSLQKIDLSELTATEKFWYSHIQEESKLAESTSSEEIYSRATFEGGFDLNNTISKDGLRPQVNELYFLPNGAIQLYGEKGAISAQIGLRHNLFYDKDNQGLNPMGRFQARSEDYYLGYQSSFIKLYMGRYQHLWAPYGQASTVLSTNSSSFDNLNITLGNSWFKVSGIFAELDNLGIDGTFDRGGKNMIGGTKRFLALHRIDIKVKDNFRLGYFDGVLYSSVNSVNSLKYVTPLNVLFFERNTNPLNDEFNAFFGGLIWWNYANMTMNLQVMIDDIVINSDIGVEEPATFAITNSVNLSKITDNIDIGYEAELVAYQTYNTDQAEGRYLFLKRGIANQYNDYAFVSAYLNYYAYQFLPGLIIKPSVSFLAQGEQEINQDFVREYENGEIIDVVLTGVVEKTSRISFDLLYNPTPNFWINTSLGYNYLSNKDHISGNSDSLFTGRFEAGFRVFFDNNTETFSNFLKSIF